MNLFPITDPGAEQISLKQWLDERISAYTALDCTCAYNEDVRFFPITFLLSDTKRLRLHMTDVRFVARELDLPVNVSIRPDEQYPIELSVVYKNVELFSIYDKPVEELINK